MSLPVVRKRTIWPAYAGPQQNLRRTLLAAVRAGETRKLRSLHLASLPVFVERFFYFIDFSAVVIVFELERTKYLMRS